VATWLEILLAALWCLLCPFAAYWLVRRLNEWCLRQHRWYGTSNLSRAYRAWKIGQELKRLREEKRY
jgi:hypothetical protein